MLYTEKFPLISILRSYPQAVCEIKGSSQYPQIRGLVRFYQTRKEVVVYADIQGLPREEGLCEQRIFGFHIHDGESCTGNAEDPFAMALGHYNPHNCQHPDHAGDMPPLFGCDGKAILVFASNRFAVRDVLGKAVIIHDHPDDFKTQPSGDSGSKIACGIIQRTR